jgi:YkoY family integral membrane protein
VSFDWSDLLTILILVGLEGILSADNALVLAVMVLPLPPDQQRKALRYGLIGAFVLRTIATLLAIWLVKIKWITLVGGLYLLFLCFKHFTAHKEEAHEEGALPLVAKGILGLSLFWSTVIKVELTDLVFAVDSILVAVGVTHGDPTKTWVIIVGGILGIIMMRLLTMQVLELVKRYPKLIDGAYIIIAWVGIKLVWEYLHHEHIVPFGIPKEWAIGIVIVLFVASYLYARAHPADDAELAANASEAERLVQEAHEKG